MSKKKIIPGTPNLQNTAYFDLNRNFSIKSDDTSTWEYPINNGMRLPAGTNIEIINTHLNYPGIVGSAIEILEDIEETISYGFYNVHGSFFALTPDKFGNPQTNLPPTSDGTKGMLLHDLMAHRNTENTPTKAPLLKVTSDTTIDNDPSTELTVVEAEIETFDLTDNVDNPETTLVLDDLRADAVYTEYSRGFNSFTSGYTYTSSFTDRVIDITVTNAGVNYSVGDKIEFTGGTTSNKRAFGWVTAVDPIAGFITDIKLAQVGEDYTSTPTATVNSPGGGAGAVIGVVMGGIFATTTNGSGIGLIVAMQGDMSSSLIHSIVASGMNYRAGDKCFVNDGTVVDYTKYPVENPTHALSYEPAIATFTVTFTNALDVPSPGYFTVLGTGTNEETIYYRNASNADDTSKMKNQTQPLLFTANENPALDNSNYTETNMFFQKTGGYYTNAQNCRYVTQMLQYFYPPSDVDTGNNPLPAAKGSGYKWIPQVTYRSAQYEEEFLNTDIGEPAFIPIMTTDHKVDRVVYLPGCRDDISSMNTFIDFNVRTKGDAVFATYGCPPGYLGIIGGDPTTEAYVDFKPSFAVNYNVQPDPPNVPGSGPDGSGSDGKAGGPGKDTGQTYGHPALLKRYINNTGGVKLGLNVGILYQGDSSIPPGSMNLIQIADDPGSGTGTGCVVDVGVGFGFTAGPIFSLNVTASGSGYKVGERYSLNNMTSAIVVILEISNDGTIVNGTNTSHRDAQLIRPNIITGGIMDNLNNNLAKSALIKGKTNKLPGDITDQSAAPLSSLPRFNYSSLGVTGYDNIEAAGGSNDPLGCVEFTSDGFLKPFIQQKTITIPRGVYGVNQLGALISDQLTETTEDDYISSAISKLVPVNNYEISNFSGVENAQAGRKIFISMSNYNTLMELYREGESIPDSFKWDTFRFTNYYAFPKNFFPSGKSATQGIASLRFNQQGVFEPGGATRSNFIKTDNSNIPPYDGALYDQTRDGILIGTTDFQLIFNDKKSVYELQFLHSAIRNPVYDKFGNVFPQPGEAGAFLKKLSKQLNLIGTRKQYRNFFGGVYKTPEELLKRFIKPITRETGIMIYNFAYDTALANTTKDLIGKNPEYFRYEDFFREQQPAEISWAKTLWSRLGFKYAQLNTDASKISCQYLFTDPSQAVKMYGVTTDQALDNSVTTTISSLTNQVRSVNTQTPPSNNPPSNNSNTATANQQVFNMTTSNNPSIPVKIIGNVRNVPQYIIDPQNQNPLMTVDTFNVKKNFIDSAAPIIYSSGIYNSAMTNFVVTDGDPLTAQNLPLLIQEGYFLITSDIIDSYKDSVKKNENIPVLAIVPKSNLASQDFVTTAFTNISHTLSQEKVINKILVKVLNPDLTAPILREDSSILMKITIPEAENVLI